MDRFSKICLVLIVIFLAIIALRPTIAPQPVSAQSAPKTPGTPSAPAQRYHEYSYFAYGTGRVEELASQLTSATGNGWQVVGVTAVGQYNNQVLVLLGR